MNEAFFKHAMSIIDNMTVEELEAGLKEYGFVLERHEASNQPQQEDAPPPPPQPSQKSKMGWTGSDDVAR